MYELLSANFPEPVARTYVIKKCVLEYFVKFREKYQCHDLFFDEVTGRGILLRILRNFPD